MFWDLVWDLVAYMTRVQNTSGKQTGAYHLSNAHRCSCFALLLVADSLWLLALLYLLVLFATSVLFLLLCTWLGCCVLWQVFSSLKDLGFQLGTLPLAWPLLSSLASLFCLELTDQPPPFAV